MTIFWPALIAGAVLILVGIVVFAAAQRVHAFIQSGQDNVRPAFLADRSSTPKTARAVGVVLIFFGILGVVLSALNLNW
jgi:uncharacterized membrane protein HdeD (DUF308 family)